MKKLLKVLGIVVAVLALLYGVLYMAETMMQDEMNEISNCLSEEEEQYQNETTKVMETLDQPERREYFCEKDTKQLSRLITCYEDKREKYPISFFVAFKFMSMKKYLTGMITDHNKICPNTTVETPSFF